VEHWAKQQTPIIPGLAYGLVHGDLAQHFANGIIAAGSHFAVDGHDGSSVGGDGPAAYDEYHGYRDKA
jgi:hypothetical protein